MIYLTMSGTGTKKRVCILEDDDDIREVIVFLLESENYQVSAFGTVNDFAEKAYSVGADVFILDVMLPDGNGLEVCRSIKENATTQHVPVLMMSANYSPHDVMLDCRAQDFIRKPFDILDFVKRVGSQAFPH